MFPQRSFERDPSPCMERACSSGPSRFRWSLRRPFCSVWAFPGWARRSCRRSRQRRGACREAGRGRRQGGGDEQ